MRMTLATALVLEAIAAGRRYGFDIMDVSGLPDGTVYPVLRRLESEGLLESAWEEPTRSQDAGRPARRYYRITDSGRRVLAEARERFAGMTAALRAAATGEAG